MGCNPVRNALQPGPPCAATRSAMRCNPVRHALQPGPPCAATRSTPQHKEHCKASRPATPTGAFQKTDRDAKAAALQHYPLCKKAGCPATPVCLAVPARQAFYMEWLSARPACVPRPLLLGPSTAPYVFAAPAWRVDVQAMRGGTAEVAGAQPAAAATRGGACSAKTRADGIAAATLGAAAAAAAAVAATESGSAEASMAKLTAAEHGGEGQDHASSEHRVSNCAGAATVAAAAAAAVAAVTAAPTPATVPAAATIAAIAAANSSTFSVNAGSFQCVWFFSLGAAHHKVIIEWWRSQRAPTADCVIAAEPADLPQVWGAGPPLLPSTRPLP
eukprot:365887-Chlamydomonas_euryale.AAC.1